MPPRCYPPEPEFGPGGTAERRVWEVLRDQLPGEAALLHSVALIENAAEREADLVVAWPGVGIAVIEVKGGHISREHGQWYQSSGGSTRPMKDPVRQAQDCKHVLRRLLAKRGSAAAAARSAHLVAFPFTLIGPGWSCAGCTRDMVLARGDLAEAAGRTRAVIARHGGGSAPLSGDGLESLLEVLEGELPGQVSLLSWAEENEAYVDQLTRDQAKVARILREQRRLKVIGGAGTGKTWLALEQARSLAAAGERVALVCYSRGLARFLQRMTAGWPPAHRPAYTGLFHALPLAWGADPPPDEADLAASIVYYEEHLPAQMGELAARLGREEKYDAIVVDEAQDLGAAWWPPTLACLRDQETGGLYAFLDEAQRVFERHGDVPIPLPPIVLEENIRNTRQIARVFGSLGAAQARYRGMDGPPVRFVQCAPEEAVYQADAQVDALLGEGWEPGQIVLLVTGRRHQLQKEMLDYHGWDGYWDAFFAGDEVFYGHVLGFKGLERPVVVLAVNGMRDLSRGREYLYVGLSRARSLLVVCGDLDQIAAAGGEGIRRRLSDRRLTGTRYLPRSLSTRPSLGDSGSYLAARDLFQLIADAYTADDAYGPDHPDTLTARGNLARWSRSQISITTERDMRDRACRPSRSLEIHARMHDPAYLSRPDPPLGSILGGMHDRASQPAMWGKDLRRRRLELRLRQDELAALAGVSTRFVHTLEQGKPTVRLDKVLAVLRQLGLDLVLEPGSGILRGGEG